MSTNKQLKLIKTQFRYSQLDEDIGTVVQISSYSSSEDAIRSALIQKLPYLAKAIKNDGIEKYRSIYIDFEASGQAPTCEAKGLRFIRECGLLPSKEEIEEINDSFPPTDPDLTYLDLIIEDLEQGKIWVKLRLEPVDKKIQKRNEDGQFIERDFLQNNFKIVDACITNVECIWLMKNFYM